MTTGIRGLHHVGISVPDVAGATRFFVDALGCTKVADLPPISGEGDWMRQHLGVHPDARVAAIAMLRCPDGSTLELLEFASPEQRLEGPGNADVGSPHLAFEVDNVPAAAERLRAMGCHVMGGPKLVTDGPTAGTTWVYVRAPWGLQLEFISRPS